MSSLFLDTSDQIVFGVLSETHEWLAYRAGEGKKASKVLHALILETLEELGLETRDLKDMFFIAGPGSYTGVRVAKGLAEILEWQGVGVYSCRHFDVPVLLGENKGVFVSRAFKKEVFWRQWEGKTFEQKLLPENDLKAALSETDLPCFSSETGLFERCSSTHSLIKRNPKELFGQLSRKNMKSEVFYYRKLEEEFTKGTK